MPDLRRFAVNCEKLGPVELETQDWMIARDGNNVQIHYNAICRCGKQHFGVSKPFPYYRALPKSVVTQDSRHVMTTHDAFDWVEDIEQGTKDYFEAASETQRKLKEQHNLDSELVEIEDSLLMQPKYVVCRTT